MSIVVIYALNALLFANVLFLISAGLNLIYGVMRIVNLAHGSLYALGAYVTAWTILNVARSVPPPVLYLVPLLGAGAVAIVGLVLEPTLLRPMYKRAEEYQLIITFGALLIFEDSLRLTWGPYPLLAREPYEYLGSSNVFGFQYPNYNILIIGLGFAVGLFLWAFVQKTKFGVMIRATSLDREMASALGVNVSRLFTVAFIIGAALAGLGGSLVVPTTAAVLGMGIEVLVFAFVATVIGGLGSLKGAFIGAIIVGTVRALGITFFPEIELAIIYLITAAVLLIRPRGLFGRE